MISSKSQFEKKNLKKSKHDHENVIDLNENRIFISYFKDFRFTNTIIVNTSFNFLTKKDFI
jgi:hypothetical protein